MKCRGRIEEEDMRICGAELKNVGFVKDDCGNVASEHYSCEEDRCSLYRSTQIVQTLPTTTIKEEN